MYYVTINLPSDRPIYWNPLDGTTTEEPSARQLMRTKRQAQRAQREAEGTTGAEAIINKVTLDQLPKTIRWDWIAMNSGA